MITNEPLLVDYENDGLPVFRLNRIRRKCRSKFIKEINSGKIKLETVEECACGCCEFLNISNKDRFGLPFRNIICQNCGLLITNPRIAEISLPRYYSEIYHPLIVGKRKGDIPNYLVSENQGEEIFKFCEQLFDAEKAVLRVLEIGCANGSVLVEFADLIKSRGVGCELFGTEYENENARKAMESGIKIIDGDLGGILQEGPLFDIVILSHVFEHISDLNKFIKQLSKILDSKGFIYVEVPGVMNEQMLSNWYGDNFIDYVVHAHMYNFNLASLKYIFELNGFGMIEGDESVRAVFKQSGSNKTNGPLKGNCEHIVNYLKSVSLRGNNSISLKSLLKKYYFKNILRKIYYKSIQKSIIESNLSNCVQ